MMGADVLLVIFLAMLTKGRCCQHTFSSDMGRTGSFTSPGYPEFYRSQESCTYHFRGTSDERIKISFVDFDLLPGEKSGCLHDYVEVYTIDVDEIKFLNRYCGQTLPDPIISVLHHVQVVFKSTKYFSGNNRGFNGTFEFIDELWQPFPPSPEVCGPTVITGVGGELHSPNYPKPYPANVECTWMISVEKGSHILLTFVALDMGQSVQCTNEYLRVYNGFASPTVKPDMEICGQLSFEDDNNVDDFRSRSYRIVVRFKAKENYYLSSGIKIAWTAVYLPEIYEDENGFTVDGPCHGFHCKGGEYCIDTSGLLCNPLPRYCISETLLCNKLPNCGLHDQSDEHYCWLKLTLILLGILVPILTTAVVTCGVIQFRRYRVLKQKQAEKERQFIAGHLHSSDSYDNSRSNNSFTWPPPYGGSPMSYATYSSHRRGSRRGSGKHGYVPCHPPASENYYSTPNTTSPTALVMPIEHHYANVGRRQLERNAMERGHSRDWEREREMEIEREQGSDGCDWEREHNRERDLITHGYSSRDMCYASPPSVRRPVARLAAPLPDNSPYYQTVAEARESDQKVHTVIV